MWMSNQRTSSPVSALAVELAEVLTQTRHRLVKAGYGVMEDDITSHLLHDPYAAVSDVQLSTGRTLSKSLLIAALINLQLLVPATNVWIVHDKRVIHPQSVQALLGSPLLSELQ